MAKYGNFENQPLSRKQLPIERKYAQCRRPGLLGQVGYLPRAKLVLKQRVKAHGPLVLIAMVLCEHIVALCLFLSLNDVLKCNMQKYRSNSLEIRIFFIPTSNAQAIMSQSIYYYDVTCTHYWSRAHGTTSQPGAIRLTYTSELAMCFYNKICCTTNSVYNHLV